MKIERMYVPAPPAVERKTGRGTLTERAVELDHQEKEKNQRQSEDQREAREETDDAQSRKEQKSSHLDVVA